MVKFKKKTWFIGNESANFVVVENMYCDVLIPLSGDVNVVRCSILFRDTFSKLVLDLLVRFVYVLYV